MTTIFLLQFISYLRFTHHLNILVISFHNSFFRCFYPTFIQKRSFSYTSHLVDNEPLKKYSNINIEYGEFYINNLTDIDKEIKTELYKLLRNYSNFNNPVSHYTVRKWIKEQLEILKELRCDSNNQNIERDNQNNYNQNTKPSEFKNIKSDVSLSIPSMSFITCLSEFHKDRHGNLSSIAQTALFNSSFTIPMKVLLSLTKNSTLNDDVTIKYTFFYVFNSRDLFDKYKITPKIEVLVGNIQHLCSFLNSNSYNISYLIIIFCDFTSWNDIVTSIYNTINLTITGGDSTKRHLVSDLKIRLHYFLVYMVNGNLSQLRKNLIFNIDKKIITPKINFSRKNQSYLRLTPSLHNSVYKEENQSYSKHPFNSLRNSLKTNNSLVLTENHKRSYHSLQESNLQSINKSLSSFKQINLYNDIKTFFKNNTLNSETQLKLENYLVEYSYTSIDNNILNIDASLLNKKAVNFLLPYHELIFDKIETFLSKKDLYNKNEDPVNYYLYEFLVTLNKKYVSGIIFGIFLRIVSNERNNLEDRNNAITIMNDIAISLLREYLYLLYKSSKKEDESFSEWKKVNIDYVNIFNDINLTVKIGGILVEWMIDIDLIHEKCISTDKNKLLNIFSITKTINHEIESKILQSPIEISSMINNIITLPMRLPMICKPKLYTRKPNGSYTLGGYLLNDVKFIDDIILTNYEFKEKSRVTDNTLYDTINNVNSVGYKINTDVLDFLNTHQSYYEDDLLDFNIPHPLLNKTTKLTTREKTELQKYLSKLDLQRNIFNIADTYSIIPEFYFINRLDSRGRLYCINEYLNYQGSELAKSLLLFSRPSHVKRDDIISLNYLKVFGANCYGNKINKLSIEKKIEWVDLNYYHIVNFREGELIKKADNKFLFTAFCIEFNRWIEFYDNSLQPYFQTYLPIQLDATCNGFQHLALLGLDHNLCKELNLTESSFYDNPKDFYTYLISLLLHELEDKLDRIRDLEKNLIDKSKIIQIRDLEIENNLSYKNKTAEIKKKWEEKKPLDKVNLKELKEFEKDRDLEYKKKKAIIRGLKKNLTYDEMIVRNKESYERLYSFNIHRKLIKTAIMTIPYNAKNLTLVEYIKDSLTYIQDCDNEWYIDNQNSDLKLSYNDIYILVEEIRFILKDKFPQLTRLIKYLEDIATICTILGLYIPWCVPSGLEVRQSYLTSKSIQIKPFAYSNTKFSIKTYIDKYDKNIQIRAFMPNLIHSLDACTLALLINDFFKADIKIKNIYTIHDCFAMTMDNVDYVIELLKINYIKLYSDIKYLEKFNDFIINYIKQHFGENCYNSETHEIILPDLKPMKFPDIRIVSGKNLDVESLRKSSFLLI